MRCNNCGWLNADGDSHCVKCNSLLAVAASAGEGLRQPAPADGTEAGAAETLRGVPAAGESLKELIPCPACEYPASSQVERCPMCGSLLNRDGASGGFEATHRDGEGTVHPFRQPEEPPQAGQPMLLLERVGRPEEPSKTLPFAAVDSEVQVNRQLLDENNFTITSRLQASFVFRDNKWWLLDRSELKTTFIQVKEAVELKDGDIILMGDRRFIFYYDGVR